jgi:antitoxin VapB
MTIAKLFTNGRSQAVRLPKEFRFDGDEVCIARIDEMVVLYPPGKGWDLLTRGLQRCTEDFMAHRDQPATPEDRETL